MANEEEEESRVVAAKLFNSLAPNIGRELCEIYVVPTIASFAEDTNSKVRKAVASNFLEMCKSISAETFRRKIIPVYEKLSYDSLWIVRKTAASIIYLISEIIQDNKDKAPLINIFKHYTQDNQKFVRHAAVEIIGKFTNTLPIELRDKVILDFYIKTIIDFYQSKEIASQADNEMLYNCAFNFPAMLFLFGKDYWKDLKPCYLKMSGDKYFKVRKSLASSINEVASIIGKDETETVLIPIFERFYREEGEIQKTIYKSMPKFLLNIQPEKRKVYLEKLKRLLRSREKWRTKREYVEILGNLGGVFDDELTFTQIFPVCLNMCFDEVNEVRIHAAKSIKSLILHFLSKEQFREKIKDILFSFATSMKYIYRLLFIYLAREIIDQNEVINEYFIDHLEKLSRDKIVNIQYVMASFCIDVISNGGYRNNRTMRTIIIRLMNSKNLLVRECFDNLRNNEFILSFSKDEVEEALNYQISNEEFINKMEIFKEFSITQAHIPSSAKNRFTQQQKTESPKTELKLSVTESNSVSENKLDNYSNQSNSISDLADNDYDAFIINNNSLGKELVGKYFEDKETDLKSENDKQHNQ